MSETRIKICGIREIGHAHVAIDEGADYIGLVFAEGSPRKLEIAEARNLIAEICAASSSIEPVAMFAQSVVRTDPRSARQCRLQDRAITRRPRTVPSLKHSLM